MVSEQRFMHNCSNWLGLLSSNPNMSNIPKKRERKMNCCNNWSVTCSFFTSRVENYYPPVFLKKNWSHIFKVHFLPINPSVACLRAWLRSAIDLLDFLELEVPTVEAWRLDTYDDKWKGVDDFFKQFINQ